MTIKNSRRLGQQQLKPPLWSETCCAKGEKLFSAHETNFNPVMPHNSERSLTRVFHHAHGILFAVLVSFNGYAQNAQVTKPQPPPGTYLNPIGDPPIHLQEPYILVQGKKYFLFGTASSAEGFRCYESPDLVHWKLDGWAWRKSGPHVAQGDLHSPQVFVYQGMFCMVYSARMPNGTHLALAASVQPQGPYHDLHVPWLDLGDACIDGDVFVDSNSKAYLIFTRKSRTNGCNYSAIYGVALNKDLSKTVGSPVKLVQADQRWELLHKDVNQCNESPRMIKIAFKYYLTYSANDRLSPDYGIGYALAGKPLGPWTKSEANPLLQSRPEIGVFGPGHGAVFQSLTPYEWFIVYDSLADATNRSEDHLVNLDRVDLRTDRTLITKGPTPPRLPAAGAKP